MPATRQTLSDVLEISKALVTQMSVICPDLLAELDEDGNKRELTFNLDGERSVARAVRHILEHQLCPLLSNQLFNTLRPRSLHAKTVLHEVLGIAGEYLRTVEILDERWPDNPQAWSKNLERFGKTDWRDLKRRVEQEINDAFDRAAPDTEPQAATHEAAHVTEPEAQQEAPRRRGRPKGPVDPGQRKLDRRLFDAWKGGKGNFRTLEGLGTEFNMTRRDVRLAVDRERKRRARK